MSAPLTFTLDDQPVPFQAGQTLMEAAQAAGIYIPHLCHHPELPSTGSCRLCVVELNGRLVSACTQPAQANLIVANRSGRVMRYRKQLLQMLFVEGNHQCPGCEQSGRCQLQAVAYWVGMLSSHYTHFYPKRPLDASHPDVVLDFNRCILCGLCVRASTQLDGKGIFALSGRGLATHLVINSPTGRLGDSSFSITDRAAHLCPVGVFLARDRGYDVPIGQRLYDQQPIPIQGDIAAHRDEEGRI